MLGHQRGRPNQRSNFAVLIVVVMIATRWSMSPPSLQPSHRNHGSAYKLVPTHDSCNVFARTLLFLSFRRETRVPETSFSLVLPCLPSRLRLTRVVCARVVSNVGFCFIHIQRCWGPLPSARRCGFLMGATNAWWRSSKRSRSSSRDSALWTEAFS